MRDRLEYKGFIGAVHFAADEEVFYGKLEGVNDLVTFEGTSVRDLKKSFKEAVIDYINICKETGKNPMKSFKGSFNVRISPEMHMEVFKQATREGKNLNEFVQQALANELDRK